MLKNTTQCPRLGLEPRPLDPETSALTRRPRHLPWPVKTGVGRIRRQSVKQLQIEHPVTIPSNQIHLVLVSGRAGTWDEQPYMGTLEFSSH